MRPQQIVPTRECETLIAQAGLSKSALARESGLSRPVIFRMLNPAAYESRGSVRATSA